MKNIAFLIATFFGSGYSPKAPGTAGSLASLIPLIIVAYTFSTTTFALILVIGILLFINFGIIASNYVEKELSLKDPGLIVIDEAAGQWITFLFISKDLLIQNPWLFAIGFGLFRFFDILKPPPIKLIEKLPSGFGIMLDDVAAGLYACICLNLIIKFVIL